MVSACMLAQAEPIFAWYNAVFVVFFGVGLLFTFLQLLGLSHGPDADAHVDPAGHLEADADAQFDVHADADAPGDLDAQADLNADADAHAAAGGHVEVQGDGHGHAPAGHGLGVAGAVAQLLGIGRIPLSISLMILCYTAGIVGWMSNEVLSRHMGSPKAFFPLSLLASLTAALVVIRLSSMFLNRYLPTVSTSALGRRQLVGMTAKATLPVNERFGQARLYDRFGTLHVVGCKVREGAAGIEKGSDVVLIKYVPERDLFIVGRA